MPALTFPPYLCMEPASIHERVLWRDSTSAGLKSANDWQQRSNPNDKEKKTAKTVAASNGRVRTIAAASATARPIGVFDSGIGGLTVLKALTSALPGEDFIYLGDTARLPYGTKSNEVIIRYSKRTPNSCSPRGSRCWWWRATPRARWR